MGTENRHQNRLKNENRIQKTALKNTENIAKMTKLQTETANLRKQKRERPHNSTVQTIELRKWDLHWQSNYDPPLKKAVWDGWHRR